MWQYLHRRVKPGQFDFSQAVLFHSGGWKKLTDQAVSSEVFKMSMERSLKLRRIHNFYGMVEQVGAVYVECGFGYFHPPNFSDVIIRSPETWEPVPLGEVGVVEVLSLLPLSYPGHALLTEDLGVIAGVDDCECGQRGKYFTIVGRIPKAEIRGCSDTHSVRSG